MIYIDDYTDGFEFLDDAKEYDAEFSLSELRQIISVSDEYEMNQCLRELIRRYRYKKEIRLSGTVFYKSNIYSYNKRKDSSYTKKMLSLKERGMCDIVLNFEKSKLEKEKVELEQRKKCND